MKPSLRSWAVAVAAALASLLASTLVTAAPARAAAGLHVSGTDIAESNGNRFIMRGVSHAHTWYTSQTRAFADIKALGANTVRVVLSGGRWTANGPSDVANVIELCKQNRLICVLENHDTTGYGEQDGARTLDQAVDYWLSLREVLVGQEDYIVINIGNEPVGNNPVTPDWTTATSNAIQRLRDAGFDHLLMVDAPNWGQDWQFTMRDNARTVFAADPDRNTVFSVHMYGVFDTAAEITDYLARFRTAGLPLVIGEFGFDHSDGDPDEDTVMAEAQARGVGYIGWSWSGNGGGVEYLDMVANFDPSQLTGWGQRIFNGADGIRATAREATVYSGENPDTTAPTAPGAPTASDITATSATLTWSASTDTGGSGLAGYDVHRADGTLLGQTATASVTLTGLTPATRYEVYVRARDFAGNRSAPSPTATFTTAEGGMGACRVAYTVNAWNDGLVANIKITNTGDTAVNGWSLAFTLPAGQTITSGWGATYSPASGRVTATNVSYNAAIPAQGSIDIGFQATHTGDPAEPGAFTLNGFTCETA
ncbi:cellulase family glycosylhydrolase [Actinomadura keratinilytica]|uniref:Endoglucanase n=2 Tax=Actinomadura keratinilytica TaxID=547461 RepID=A0ABP7Z6V9_9ACTN